MGVNLLLTGSKDGYPEGSEYGTDLCTNFGYVLLCEWIESLDAGKYPLLRALADDGRAHPTDKLAEEINAAIDESPPVDPDTLHVANRLADLLGAGRSNETVAIEA
jgi:hypothetical protein